MIGRPVRAGLTLATVMLASAAAIAQTAPPKAKPGEPLPNVTMGVANIVVRVEGREGLGVIPSDLRTQLVEHLKEKGLRLAGENAVFGRDETGKAEFLLGGTVRELSCRGVETAPSCRIGVEWQLLDAKRDAVVYSVITRAAAIDVRGDRLSKLGPTLVNAAVDRLLARPRFRAALAAATAPTGAASTAFAPATFAACDSPVHKMPEGAEDVLSGTVVVRSGGGHGSGFILDGDGLVLTAAHVVTQRKVTLRLRDGSEVEAVPVRIAPRADVALLRATRPLGKVRCLPLTKAEPPVGADTYAAGAPADQQLAFSLTRGIVSGTRETDGERRLQTDAPISPGNSGGPLVDATGSVAAIVSSKLAGGRVEGIAFGVPTEHALAALGLRPGTATDAELRTATTEPSAPLAAAAAQTDTPDPEPSLDPEGDKRRDAEVKAKRDYEERVAARDRATPGYVGPMFGTGIVIASVGATFVIATYAQYDSSTTTKSDFSTLRTENTVAWVALLGGAGLIVTSRILRPALPAAAALGVGPGGVSLTGRFE